jgi:hypothetical protein
LRAVSVADEDKFDPAALDIAALLDNFQNRRVRREFLVFVGIRRRGLSHPRILASCDHAINVQRNTEPAGTIN